VLNGSMEVGQGAGVWAQNARVTGGVVSNFAANTVLIGTGTRIGAGVQIKDGVAARIVDARITGDLQFEAMRGAVTAARNTLVGNLQVMQNRGGVTLNRNSMTGAMQCKDNLPAPTGSLNTASIKEDQCLGL
jgi:hypothetical protein